MKRFLCLVLAAACLSSCSTSVTSLDYAPGRSRGVMKGGRHNVKAGIFRDNRGESETYLGQIREAGPIGKTIETSIPVARIVGNTFGYALQTRGMLAGSNPQWVISGDIQEFSCDQVIRAGATVDISVKLTRVGSRRPAFVKSFTAEKVETTTAVSFMADPGHLRDLASRALQEAIDRALDDPELRKLTDD